MRGRRPRFTREEADRIIADNDALDVLALRYGVSHVTIMRVKSMGVYSGVGYIARDEVDLSEDEKDRIRNSPPPAPPSKRGRKYATGRYWPVTDEERAEIINDKRTVEEIAAEHMLATSYVTRLKSLDRVVDRMATSISPSLAVMLRDSDEPTAKLAMVYSVHPRIIEALRDGTIKVGVTSGGNDGGAQIA